MTTTGLPSIAVATSSWSSPPPTSSDRFSGPPLPSSSFRASSSSSSSSSSSAAPAPAAVAPAAHINIIHTPDTFSNINTTTVDTRGGNQDYTCLHCDRTFTAPRSGRSLANPSHKDRRTIA
ncbi:hypothetical protein SprV_0301268000 [Sparganum proliferum]